MIICDGPVELEHEYARRPVADRSRRVPCEAEALDRQELAVDLRNAVLEHPPDLGAAEVASDDRVIGHNCIGHDYIGHHYKGRNYIYIVMAYIVMAPPRLRATIVL